MRVSNFFQNSGEIEKKTRRKKRRNNSAIFPHSFLSRFLHKKKEQSKLCCLIPFSKSLCNNEKKMEEMKEGFCSDEQKEKISTMAESVGEEKEKKSEAFNLGMGAGLVFLLAKSANEFNKMVELRSEMEMMIKYIKGELQRKDVGSNLPESKIHSFPNSNYLGSECSNKPQHLLDDTESCNFAGVYSSTATRRRLSNLNMDFDAKMRSKGNEIEQELQVELQLLQLNLEDQDSSIFPHQDRLEINSEFTECFNDTYHQQINEPNKAETNEQTGICPRELERRLHELLEARQQERIVELQTALECAERKLNEKEMEICWWRDTARLVSKHRDERYQLQF